MTASRGLRFERSGFESRYGRSILVWPVPRKQLQRVGQSVLADRDGTGRPHDGVDLFASPGTPVLAALGGEVLRVVDRRESERSSSRRAGLFIDVKGDDGLIYRFLHLGRASVQAGARVAQGAELGAIAEPFTSGLRDAPHLHFEIRRADFSRSRGDYGPPVDPLLRLPRLET